MTERDYALSGSDPRGDTAAPDLPYRPPVPKNPPTIALVGAGGIAASHLAAYKASGFDVAAICSRTINKAEARRDEFYPDAHVTADYHELLARENLTVFDITPHPADRIPIVEAALKAGKHVLSQKPFVSDLADGERLCDLADAQGVRLAVNQNGRWAPHFAYIREAIKAGLVGDVGTVDFLLHWDHTWTAGTPFEEIHHLILADFAIHWCDIATAFLGGALPLRVFSQLSRAPYQTVKPPFFAAVSAVYASGAQVRINFNAHTKYGPEDRTVVAGSKGTIRAAGPSIDNPTVTLDTEAGHAQPHLEGSWFSSGFAGTMAELLCAIEENRTPDNNARDNLTSLRFNHAAIRSANSGLPVTP